jgi:ankyrin repeat protein
VAETVQVLLSFGADVTVRDDTHSTPLHLASSRGSPEIARLLTEHGADVNAQDGNHKTPLLLALSSQKLETKLFTENGADINMRDGSHNIPLHLALSRRPPEVARLLIEHGTNVNALDDGNRKTPFRPASPLVSVKLRDSCYSTGLM